VSDKTVEKHLSNAFRKLDVTQRDQLGSVLAKQ
jgi:DNA-binding NarL/FixJ family response regulator